MNLPVQPPISSPVPPPAPPPRRFGCLAVTLLLLLVTVVSVVATLWVARTWLFPGPFQPVALNTAEQIELERKLDRLTNIEPAARRLEEQSPTRPSAHPRARAEAGMAADAALTPAPYAERPEDRLLSFSQRELNAMIARNPDLAERLVLHLADGMLSASMRLTLPRDLPVLAGQTIRISTGLRLGYRHGQPQLAVEGVSVMGVPLPNAWIGGIKGEDLIGLGANDGGFWSVFGQGVRDLRIEGDRLFVELAE